MHIENLARYRLGVEPLAESRLRCRYLEFDFSIRTEAAFDEVMHPMMKELLDFSPVQPCAINRIKFDGDCRVCSQCNLQVLTIATAGDDSPSANLVPVKYNYAGDAITQKCPEKLKHRRDQLYVLIAGSLLASVFSLQHFGFTAPTFIFDFVCTATLSVGYASTYLILAPIFNGEFRAHTFLAVIEGVIYYRCLLKYFQTQSERRRKRYLYAALIVALVPLLTYATGLYIINNTGGLGSGSD